jgi:hypothetical protein
MKSTFGGAAWSVAQRAKRMKMRRERRDAITTLVGMGSLMSGKLDEWEA